MQDLHEHENASILTSHPDVTSNPEIPAELRETVQLLLNSFLDAVAFIRSSGRNSHRRLYVLYYLSQVPEFRIDRQTIAEKLQVSIHTLHKDIAFCKSCLAKACRAHDLPENAFLNLISNL